MINMILMLISIFLLCYIAFMITKITNKYFIVYKNKHSFSNNFYDDKYKFKCCIKGLTKKDKETIIRIWKNTYKKYSFFNNNRSFTEGIPLTNKELKRMRKEYGDDRFFTMLYSCIIEDKLKNEIEEYQRKYNDFRKENGMLITLESPDINDIPKIEDIFGDIKSLEDEYKLKNKYWMYLPCDSYMVEIIDNSIKKAKESSKTDMEYQEKLFLLNHYYTFNYFRILKKIAQYEEEKNKKEELKKEPYAWDKL